MLNLELFSPEDRVLAATSGGADSLALLWLLREAKLVIHVAHIHHGLRGQESDDDELFVRELCERENIEYSMRRVHVPSRDGRFSEDAARQERYAALLEVARKQGINTIATGHTADDNLETLLLHLARGATIGGWGGIPPVRELENGLRVVRPILHLTRAETEAICRSAAWSWRDDSSNSSARYARNRVRHEVVSLLAQIGGKSRETLARQASQAAQIRRDENEFLDVLARETLSSLQVKGKDDARTWDGARWCELPVAMSRRVLRCALCEFGLADTGVEQLEQVRRHVQAAGRRRVWSLRGGVRLEWTGAMSGNRIRLWRVQTQDD